MLLSRDTGYVIVPATTLKFVRASCMTGFPSVCTCGGAGRANITTPKVEFLIVSSIGLTFFHVCVPKIN
jgi:hypothetical protein